MSQVNRKRRLCCSLLLWCPWLQPSRQNLIQVPSTLLLVLLAMHTPLQIASYERLLREVLTGQRVRLGEVGAGGWVHLEASSRVIADEKWMLEFPRPLPSTRPLPAFPVQAAKPAAVLMVNLWRCCTFNGNDKGYSYFPFGR